MLFSVFHIDVRDLERTVCFQRLVWSSDTEPPFRIWPQARSVKFFSNHRFPSRTWSEQETMLQRTEQLQSCELFLGGWDRQNAIIYANVVLGRRFCLTFQSHFTIYKGCTGQHPGRCAVCLTDSWTRTTIAGLSQGSPGFTCSMCSPTFLDLKIFALRLRVVFPFTLNIHMVRCQRYLIENKRQKESLSGTYYFFFTSAKIDIPYEYWAQ